MPVETSRHTERQQQQQTNSTTVVVHTAVLVELQSVRSTYSTALRSSSFFIKQKLSWGFEPRLKGVFF